MVLTIWEFGNKAEKILIISISYSNQVHHFIITSAYVGCLYQVSNDIVKSGFLPFKSSRTIAMISDIEMIGKDENYSVWKLFRVYFGPFARLFVFVRCGPFLFCKYGAPCDIFTKSLFWNGTADRGQRATSTWRFHRAKLGKKDVTEVSLRKQTVRSR